MSATEYHRLYREKNKARLQAQRKEYYLRNRETIRARASAYYHSNQQDAKKRAHSYYLRNSDKVKSRAVKWRKDNLNRHNEARRANYQRPEVKARHQAYWRANINRIQKNASVLKAKNPDAFRARHRAYCLAYRERSMEAVKDANQRYMKTRGRAIRILTIGTSLKAKDLPHSAVEVAQLTYQLQDLLNDTPK